MDLMMNLVKHIVGTNFSNLTPQSVAAARNAIVDTVGNMIAGSSVKGCQLLVQAIKEMGGTGENTVAVFGARVAFNMAALANGAMARAMDIDDVSDVLPLHASVIIVPTALAVADWQGGINGRDLVTAVALGQDLLMRMAYATRLNPLISGRFNLFKVFGATGTAGKLMSLTEEQLSNAMGIAYSQMVGADSQALHEGAMTIYVQEGSVAKSAIESAMFALKGITGTRNVLQGPRGFFGAFEPDPHLDALTLELGSVFRGVDISMKPYASCRSSHEAVDLALSMVNDFKINPARIERIVMRVNDITYKLTCDPLDQKLRPKDQSEAQFSLPFIVATALMRGDFFIAELSDEIINDEDILQLATRVMPVLDKECQTDSILGTTVMEIETKDGQRFTAKKAFPKGNPRNPMNTEECLEKFRKCVKYSYRPFADSQIDRIKDTLSNLEYLEDTRQLVRQLVPW